MMTLYATGIRRAELCCLSPRKVIHIRHGKGDRDRDFLLTPKLLETRGFFTALLPHLNALGGSKQVQSIIKQS